MLTTGRGVAVVLAVLAAAHAIALPASAASRIQIRPAAAPAAIFADRDTALAVDVTADAPFSGRLTWRLAAAGATLQEGDAVVSAPEAGTHAMQLRLRSPAVKPGVAMAAVLRMAAVADGGGAAATAAEMPVWLFPADPFAGRLEWLKGLGIRLFDPEQKTADRFREAGVPFDEVRSISAAAASPGGLLVVGEGLSFRERRGLFGELARAAAAGMPVVCLAPADGQWSIAGDEDQAPPAPDRMTFRRAEVIRGLDKRLDATGWMPDGKLTARTLGLLGERGPVAVEVREGDAGWVWLELEYAAPRGAAPGRPARLVVCTLPVIERWDQGPSPRYWFAELLRYATSAPPTRGHE